MRRRELESSSGKAVKSLEMWGCTKLALVLIFGALIGLTFAIGALFIPGLIWGSHQ